MFRNLVTQDSRREARFGVRPFAAKTFDMSEIYVPHNIEVVILG